MGERPILGTPAPLIPAGTLELAVTKKLSDGVLRVTTEVAVKSLLHIYKSGVLIKTLQSHEIEDFEMRATETDLTDLQFIAVTPAGEVAATPEPAVWKESPPTTTTTTVPPPTTTTTTVPPPPTTTLKKVAAKTAAKSTAKSPATQSPKSNGKSTSGKAGQRSTSDTVKPRN
ncbi:MAG: hypothetical protein ACKODN_03705 [Actinomycetota bacterium]